METSILRSVKRNLGLELEYNAFDAEVSMHVNSALSTLSQLGFGPIGGFAIEDSTATWAQFFVGSVAELSQIKTYVYLNVRNLFDPPTTSYVMAAFASQIQELTSRLSMLREGRQWVDPRPRAPIVPADVIFDGGDAS